MSSTLATVTALLISTGILLIGNGLLLVLIPVRADMDGYSSLSIGAFGAAYYAGFALACLLASRVVRRTGHIRAFAAFAATVAAAALMHALVPTPPAWVLLRGVTGFCFAGLYVVMESWLNHATTSATRGRVFALYMVVNFTALAIGQQLVNLADPRDFVLFSVAGVLLSLALVPVVMTRAAPPAPPITTRLRLGWLYRLSPTAMTGCVGVGLASGAFFALAPAFAIGAGLSKAETATLMMVAMIGGAAAQWPLGWASDLTDRRRLIVATGICASLAASAVFVASDSGATLVIALIFLFGCFSFPVYSLSVAHANDGTASKDFVEVSSGLLLVYAMSAAAGPVVASVAMRLGRDAYLFIVLAAFHAAAAAFATYRIGRREAPAPAEREAFVGTLRSSPSLYTLDPRATEEPPEAGDDHPVSRGQRE